MSDIQPFHLQPLLTDLYQSKDLLDLSAPGPSSPPIPLSTSPNPTSLFSSASSIAAAAGRRAAAVASAAATPSSHSQAGLRGSFSPDRGGPSKPPRAASESAANGSVTCVEGYGQSLYVGGSDGIVEWWVCEAGGGAKGEGWTLRHKHTLFPRRPVSRIVLLPRVSKAFVLSDGTLHALTLPSLEPIPSTVIPPMRGVISIILDDEEMEWGGPASEDRTADMTVVLVRRRGLGLYRLGTRLVPVKEIPLPSGPLVHALSTTYLCTALPSTNTYSLIDLSDASLTEVLPVSQIDSSVLDFDPNPNIVVIPGENEFLVTSYTGASTMGVFLNGQGDPVRGTMEWDRHPLAIAIESGFVIALLRNQTITIHSLNELEKPAQMITLDSTLQAYTLSYSPYGVSIRDAIRDERMRLARLKLLSGSLAPAEPIHPKIPQASPEAENDPMSPPVHESRAEDPPSGSGLTPPTSPPTFARQPITTKRSSSLLQATAPKGPSGPFSTAVAETLIVGPNGVWSLSPLPVVVKLETLCAERKMDEAIALVDEERRKGRRGEVDADKTTHQATLRFLHLYLACQLLVEANFEKAGEYFSRGKIDPRILVRLYPRLRGKVIGSEEEVEVYEGLREVLAGMPAVEDIIAASVKRNYSPHVQPSTETAPETRELSGALYEGAKQMLTEFLRKTRQSRRKGGGGRGADSRKLDMVIDTTLAKMLAEDGATSELLSLLATPNDAVLSELEPFLQARKYVLATVLRQQGRLDRVLEIFQEIAEGQEDPLCPDPVAELASQLEGVKDPALLRKYTLWLAARSPDKALSILVSQPSKSPLKLDEPSFLASLRAISPSTANKLLEHVVITRRSPSRALHGDLLTYLLDTALEQIQDEGVQYHLEELEAEYKSIWMGDRESWPVFLGEVAPKTKVKEARLKLMLFLAGSPFVDVKSALQRLEGERAERLGFERAILLGKLGQNRRALELLARDLQDSTSAQTYCATGGEIIPPKVARKVARFVPELSEWATLGEVGRKTGQDVKAIAGKGEKGEKEKGLVLDLLGVYMGGKLSGRRAERAEAGSGEEEGMESEARALLEAQGVHLDVLEVLDLVPPSWPLPAVSSFISRSFRRQLHENASWSILKHISAGQNMQMAERYLDEVGKLPPIVWPKVVGQEAMDQENEKVDLEDGDFDEKGEKREQEAEGEKREEAVSKEAGGLPTARNVGMAGNRKVR